MSDEPEERRRQVGVERVKQSATFFNTIASGCVFAGTVVPAASILAGTMPSAAPISGG
jgi:hypothetical protein